MRYRLTNIQWDDPKLPETVEISVPEDVDADDLEQLLSDMLNDRFQSSNDGFEFTKANP